MKILHVITSLQMGGAEMLVVNLLPRLHALGHEVGLVVFNGERTMLMERLEAVCPSCRIYKLGGSYYNPLYIFKLVRIMRQYDIVHTHNSSPQLYTAIANVFCRKKLVTTEHSTNNRKRERGGLLRLIDKWMYRRYDRIICISDVAQYRLETYLHRSLSDDKCRICTINNGIDVEKFYSAKSLSDLPDRFVIVMIAGFREAKDQDTLIKAMAKLPRGRFELWLVGDGERRENLEKLVSSLRLEDNVKFLGVRNDVANVLKSADVVVMSSHWEGMSLSNIEGMSVGKPFVASNVDGLREITQGAGILFEHENADELARVILRLSEDRDFYNDVASRCYERAKQFDISKTVDGYNRVYHEVFGY
ncbi:MAG: glycosyltransferase [Prevotella sp.]|nr:glycosyltransferase [Prevotella sp.]